MKIGVYTRLSQDRDGNQTATARQEKDCRALARIKGWTVAEVYEDENLSAYSLKVRRPGFERMLEDLTGKRIDGVIVWKLDRLVRRQKDWIRFWKICDEVGAVFVSVTDGSFDTSTPIGQGVANLLVSVGEQASFDSGLRIKRAHQELADNGRWNGGGRRPFGLTKGRTTIVEEEAQLLREAAQRVLDGEGLAAVARDFSARGVKTSTGKGWRPGSLRNLLRARWIAGLREDGKKGSWPAIVDEVTSERLRSLLNDPSRNNRNGSSRSYLLSGLMYCGLCATKMIGKPHSKGLKRYACHHIPGHTACGRIGVVSYRVDELIEAAVLERLSGPALERAWGQQGDDGKILKRLRQDEEKLEELASDYFTHRSITKPAYLKVKGELERRIEHDRRQLGTADPLAKFGGAAAVRKAWQEGGMDLRRNLLRALIERIVVKPIGRGVKWDPDRINVEWRH